MQRRSAVRLETMAPVDASDVHGWMPGPDFRSATGRSRRRCATPVDPVDADLAACRATLAQGSKTFLAASLLLPRRVHEPACALYAFCRLADDAVDHPGFHGDDDDPVARLRERLTLAYAGAPLADPVDRALAAVVARHAIPRALFDALLEGFEWDRAERRYDTLDALYDYAARVAGTVGAMMALLMGVRSAEGLARACDLGVAMQLSNIARDVGEDARLGRLYLPRDWLVAAGIEPDAWLAEPVFSPALASVVERLLDAAESLYRRVDSGVAHLPLGCRPGINAARFLYAGIGHEVARRGHDSVRGRARVPGWRKAWLLLRAVTILAPGAAREPLPALPSNGFLVDAACTLPPAVAAQLVSAGADLADEWPSHRHGNGNGNGGRGIARATIAPPCRGISGQMIWVIELFARLEQRDREHAAHALRRAGAA